MLKSFVQYAPVQVFSALSVFFIIAIQARFLSVEEYGVLAVVMVLLELVRMVFSQWVNTSILRLHSTVDIDERKIFIASALFVLWVLFVPAGLVLAISLYFYAFMTVFDWLVLFSFVLLKSVYLYSLEVARLDNSLVLYRRAVISQALLSISLSLSFLVLYQSFTSALLAMAMSYLCGLVFFKVERFYCLNFNYIKRIVFYGFPIMLSGVLLVLSSRVDRLFIADALGLAEVGVYSAQSNMLLGVMSLVFMVVAMPLYPKLTSISGAPHKLQKAHAEYLDLLIAVTLPSLVGLIMVANVVVRVFLGPDFLRYGVELFWLLSVSAFIFNLKLHYIDHGLQFLFKTRVMPLISFFMLVFNLFLMFLLVESLGVYGAALASLITNFVVLVLTGVVAFRLGYIYSLGLNSSRVLLSSFFMGLALWLFNDFLTDTSDFVLLGSNIAVGVSSYVLALFSLNCFGLRKKLLKSWC